MQNIIEIINKKKYYKLYYLKPFTVDNIDKETLDKISVLNLFDNTLTWEIEFFDKIKRKEIPEDDAVFYSIIPYPDFEFSNKLLELNPIYLQEIYAQKGDTVISYIDYKKADVEILINPKNIYFEGIYRVFTYVV